MTIQDNLQNNIDYIISEYQNGRSTISLGKEFNCNRGSIWLALNKNGCEIKKRSINYGTIKDRKDEIIELFNQGYSAYKIGQILNIPKVTILRLLKKYNCDTSKKSTARKDKLVDHIQEIIDLYLSGLSIVEITEKFSCGNSTIYRLLVKNNIDPTERSQYTVKENFFDIIDSDSKAYIIGFWYADGCVNLEGKMRASLTETDKKLLEDIASILEYNGPLRYILPKNKMENSKPQWELCINRKRLTDKLIERGCVPNKSLILEFPTEDQIPYKFLSSFIRGYFDGDGSIKKTGKGSIGFTSNDLFLIKLQNFLLGKFRIETNLYYRRPNKPTASIFINKKEWVLPLLEYMYQGSTIHLERKFNRAYQLFPHLSSIVHPTSLAA